MVEMSLSIGSAFFPPPAQLDLANAGGDNLARSIQKRNLNLTR